MYVYMYILSSAAGEVGRDQVMHDCEYHAVGKLSGLKKKKGRIRFTQEVTGMVQPRDGEHSDRGKEGMEKETP